MLHWAQEHHCAWCYTSRADRQVSPVSQENRNTQTALRVRETNRGFSTFKLPRSCHTLYGCNSKEAWEGIWWRPLLSCTSEEDQLCSVGEEFLGVLSAAWLMSCVWGCRGLHARDWWQRDRKGGTSCRRVGKHRAGRMPPTAPASASLPSSVLALEVQGADSTGKWWLFRHQHN